MSDTVIRVENLSKLYRLGVIGSSTLHDDLNRWYARLRGKPDPLARIGDPPSAIRHSPNGHSPNGGSASAISPTELGRHQPSADYLWALRDVSFDVKGGEVVGIIGRNGAGKSTLLKILSRITAPTSGQVKIKGRIASLLEVGTGFHPELTGRENIYLNGAILGMRRAEIAKKFDEIVAFAEVEQFIDTPVKHYSSGMFVRLAFAVAAHLEPEILIVDEVLAVGDAAFQKKCLGKMGDVAREGRTVLFVSHNMGAISRTCERVILLNHGEIQCDGRASECFMTYFGSDSLRATKRVWHALDQSPGDNIVRLRSVCLRSLNHESREVIEVKNPFTIEIEYDVLQSGVQLTPALQLVNQDGIVIFTAIDPAHSWRLKPRPIGRYRVSVGIPGNLLNEGSITALVAISTLRPMIKHVYERDVLAFQVVDHDRGDSTWRDYSGQIVGVVRPELTWTTTIIQQ